jgi:hypothetical protein
MSRKTKEEVFETPSPPAAEAVSIPEILEQEPERELDAVLSHINEGRLVFEFQGSPYALRWPTGTEVALAQRRYAKSFHALVREGVPAVSQLDMQAILTPSMWAEFDARTKLIENGWYDWEEMEKLRDYERPEAAAVDTGSIAAAKIRLITSTLTSNPATIMFISNTAETLAQQDQNQFLTWCCLEKEQEGTWNQAYTSFEEFMALNDTAIDFLTARRDELARFDFDFLSGLQPVLRVSSGK